MTGFLLDTNVISEWQKPKPAAAVVAFLSGLEKAAIHTSIVCMLELRCGAMADPVAERRDRLLAWIEGDLRSYFAGRLLEISENVVGICFELVDLARKKRFTPVFFDMIVAATAATEGLTVATRNSKDFVPLGVPVLNPWTGERFNGA